MVSMENTIVVSSNECIDMLTGFSFKEKIGVSPGEAKTVRAIKIKAIPAYNLDKINPETKNHFTQKKTIK